MAATGNLGMGLPLENGEDDGDGDEAAGGPKNRPAQKKDPKSSNKLGGWMTAAVSSGYLGAAPSGKDDDPVDEPRISQGVDIETQTDENIGQPVAVSTKPKLPPWAKPWSPPPPKTDVEPSTNTSTEVAAPGEPNRNPDPSRGGGMGWIKGASVESSGSRPQGEET